VSPSPLGLGRVAYVSPGSFLLTRSTQREHITTASGESGWVPHVSVFETWGFSAPVFPTTGGGDNSPPPPSLQEGLTPSMAKAS
jgi:hypothetical protein